MVWACLIAARSPRIDLLLLPILAHLAGLLSTVAEAAFAPRNIAELTVGLRDCIGNCSAERKGEKGPTCTAGPWVRGDGNRSCSAFASRLAGQGAGMNERITQWDVSQITDMTYTFINAQSFNADISRWDISRAKHLHSFLDAAYIFAGDISRWNTSSATDTSWMFHDARKFNADISRWNTERVTDMTRMFHRAYKFNQDLSLWNVSRVTSMEEMFRGAISFQSDLSKWHVSKVSNMHALFMEAHAFNSDLSTWNVSKVSNMHAMFYETRLFNRRFLRWDVGNVVNMQYMLSTMPRFNGDISKWNVGRVKDMIGMFNNAVSFNQDLSRWDVSRVKDMTSMFQNALIFDGNISRWNVGKVSRIGSMFAAAEAFNGDLSRWDVGQVTDMSNAFAGTTVFNGDLSSWNVDKVTDMTSMFQNANSFNADLSGWNVEKVTSMATMFQKATSFNVSLCGTAWLSAKRRVRTNDQKAMFDGTSSGGGKISDRLCPCHGPGRFLRLADCTECPAGRYRHFSAADGPEAIVVSYYCEACPPGTWSNRSSLFNASQCTRCAAGRFGLSTLTAQTTFSAACQLCPPGSWSDATFGIDSCRTCSAGKYANLGGRTSPCILCPAGRHLHVGSDISDAPESHNSLDDCHVCGRDTYMTEPGWGESECLRCPKDKPIINNTNNPAEHDSLDDCQAVPLNLNWAILVPVAVAAVLLMAFGFLCYRRRRNQQYNTQGFALAAAQDMNIELANPLNRADFRVNPENLTIGGMIGRGGGGVMYQGMLGAAPVAVKEIIANMVNADDLSEFENEGKMVALFRHPNVLTGYGCE